MFPEACIATLSYGDLGYQEFQPPEGYVTVSRESLIESASQGLNAGQVGFIVTVLICRETKESFFTVNIRMSSD